MTTIEGTISLVEWIRTALRSDTLPPASSIYLNGWGERPEVREAIAAIEICHKQTKVAGLKTAWETTISKAIPDIAELLNKPRLFYHIDELEFETPVEWLIPQELPARAFTVIYGQSGSAKTFLAIDYAGQIAQKGGTVLYVAGEGRSGYYARYHAWLKHCGHKKSNQFIVTPHAVQLLKPAEVDAFIDEARALKPTIVFIDTLSRCMVGGDENNQKDMGLFVFACDRIRQELDCAVVVIHHTGKAGDNERGSSVLRGAADMMISVANEEGVIKIGCGKSKDSRPFAHRYCRLQETTIKQNGQDVVSCVLESWQRVKLTAGQLTNNQALILESLASELFKDGVRAPDLKIASNVLGSTFYHALSSLIKRGYAVKVGKGAKIDPIMITAMGMEWIRLKANPDNMAGDMN